MLTCRSLALLGVALLLTTLLGSRSQQLVAADAKDQAWPSGVQGFKSPLPGEHPRLFFRKADLAEIRKRAATAEGKAIVERLKVLLGGGEAMPTEYNPNRGKQPDGGGDFNVKAPVGKTYTLWHASGFGMLYQLTGEKKYADLGRQCVEKALDGQRDRDNRYSFKDPVGALRSGPSLGAIAIGYDLCYDGWDEDFRKKVALAIQNYNEGPNLSLEELARGSRLTPKSNHWGCQIGGAALALLAIQGDPGVDAKKIDLLLDANAKSFVRLMTEGFGDGGYFWEHAGPGQIASDTAFVPGMQAWKISGGKDFITPRPHASNITLIRVYELSLKPGGGYHYMLRHPSSYGTQEFGREGLSRGGQFGQGFGSVKPEYRPALQWTYQHILEPDEAKRTYDLISPYPHRAVLVLANWPIGEKERNPAGVLPRVLHDSIQHYCVFRNRWQDENDILITGLWGARSEKGAKEPVMIWGLGQQAEWGNCPKVKESSLFDVKPDGSGVAKLGEQSFAVDFGKSSGADALLVWVGPGAGGPLKASDKLKSGSVKAGDVTFHFATVSAIKHPEPKADGDALAVGGQRVTFKDGRLVLAK